MRIALIADIHGNLPALNAIVNDITGADVDQTIFLGDVAVFGPQPHECVRRLAELGCPCVMGNADAAILKHSTRPDPPPQAKWTLAQLDADDLAFLQTFQPRIQVALGDGKSLLCFHGSPDDNTVRIEPPITSTELDDKLGTHRASVMAGGHTHLSMIRQHRGMLIINPGSVGLPFERPRSDTRDFLLPWAEYGIVTCAEGMLSVALRHVEYDLEQIKQAARASQKPLYHRWLEDWVEVAH